MSQVREYPFTDNIAAFMVDKLQRLQRQSPIALRVIEGTIDDLLEPDPESAQCAVNGGVR